MIRPIVIALLLAFSIQSWEPGGMNGKALYAVNSMQTPASQMKCVAGRVTVEGDGPLPGLTFMLTGSSGNTAAIVSPHDGGDFGVRLREGEHRITLETRLLPFGYALKTFTYGATDLLRDPLMLSRSDSSELLLTFSAAPGSWVNVSGKVTGIDLLTRSYTVWMDDATLARVGTDGSFRFTKVLRGKHTLRLQSTGAPSVSKSIVVTDQDLTGVEVVLLPQKAVVGRVLTEGGQPGRYNSFTVSLRNSQGEQRFLTSASNGTFPILLPEGESQASLSGFPAGAVTSFTYGDANLLVEPLRVSRTDTAELRITLAAGTSPGGVSAGVISFGPSSCVPAASVGR